MKKLQKQRYNINHKNIKIKKIEKVIKRKLRKKILQAFSCKFISRLIKPRSLKFGKAKTPVIT